MSGDVDQARDEHQGRRHLERLVMLSDGVFAIAITLSAIELKPGSRPGLSLWQAWAPSLFIYFLSFLLIGVIWLVHRRIVAWLNHIDGPGTAINMALLSLVALVPVVVRFALTYPQREQGFLVYALAFAILALVLAVLWGYLAFVAHLATHASRGDALQLLAKLGFVAFFFLAAALFLVGWTVTAIACVVLALPLRWLAWRSGKAASAS